MRKFFILIIFFMLVSIPVFSDTDEDCMACHDDTDLKAEDGTSLFVDIERFKSSVHGELELSCTDCHMDLQGFDDYPHEEKLERLNIVNRIQKSISESINNSLIGTTEEVFVDSYSPRNPRLMSGRTRTNKVVNFPARENVLYTLHGIQIQAASAYALKGILFRDTVDPSEDEKLT